MSNLTFTIGEVAALLGVTPKTIKHYHQIGLLAEPQRDSNSYRLYDIGQIIQLQQILRLKQFGLSLGQIEIIINAENADELIQVVLSQHADNIRNEIARLQRQLDATQDFLNNQTALSPATPLHKPSVSSMTTLSDAIKSQSSGLSDILVEFEQTAMNKLDQFDWDANYELFWHFAGKHFLNTLADEGLFIFWIERYLALATMDADDLQGNAWLKELNYSPARHMLAQALMPMKFSVLPEKDQAQILKLLPALLYIEGSTLQKQFLRLLVSMR
jgi:DNA-binding transcriptional MerR regulator